MVYEACRPTPKERIARFTDLPGPVNLSCDRSDQEIRIERLGENVGVLHLS